MCGRESGDFCFGPGLATCAVPEEEEARRFASKGERDDAEIRTMAKTM
jgi:hypothetical protein